MSTNKFSPSPFGRSYSENSLDSYSSYSIIVIQPLWAMDCVRWIGHPPSTWYLTQSQGEGLIPALPLCRQLEPRAANISVLSPLWTRVRQLVLHPLVYAMGIFLMVIFSNLNSQFRDMNTLYGTFKILCSEYNNHILNSKYAFYWNI